MFTPQQNGKRTFRRQILSVLIPCLMGSVPLSTLAGAPTAPQLQYDSRSEVPLTPLPAPISLLDRMAENHSALADITAEKNTRSLTVVFGEIKLSPGSWLQVFSEDNRQSYIYNDADFYSEQGVTGFESDTLLGGKVTVRVVYPDGKPAAEDGVQILGYRAQGMAKARVIIGSSQIKQAACYKLNEEIYGHSRAVVKANGASGWNIAGGPWVMTNHHVAGDIGEKKHSLIYHYRSSDCDSENADVDNFLTIKSQRVVASGQGPGAPAPGNHDWSLYQADELAWQEAGIVPFFGALWLDTESEPGQLSGHPLYVPQHPGGRPRQISSLADNGQACGVISASADKVKYNCDTYGGSSGSPVLSQRSNGVLALHYGGSSNHNTGVNSRVVYNGIKHLLPAANLPVSASQGKGKVKVVPVSFAPGLPATVDSGVTDAVDIAALDASRMKRDGNDYLFTAKGRSAAGKVSDITVRLHPLAGPDGTLSGKLNLSASSRDNPGMDDGLLTGWMAFSLNRQADGRNVKNLILPFSSEYYDPFSSPFSPDAQVMKMRLTESQPALSEPVKHTTNIGFLAVRSGQGPMTLLSGGTGYSPLTVQVKNEAGQLQVVKLRGQRKTRCSPALRPMNSMTGCGVGAAPASLQLSYVAEDNADLPGGHYQGMVPVIASRDAFTQPLLVEVDLTVPPKEWEKPEPEPEPEPEPQPEDYDHIFPAGLKGYQAGTTVLQPATGKVYQCKPWPYSGYCSQWTSASNHFEPGIGSAWQQAWTLIH